MMPKQWTKRVAGLTVTASICVLGISLSVTKWTAAAAQSNKSAAESHEKLGPDERVEVESLGRVLIDAVNAATTEERQRHIREAFESSEIAKVGIEKIAGQLGRLNITYPGLEFDRAELSEMTLADRIRRVLHVYARRPGDKMWRDFQLYVSEGEPHRLLRLVFVAEVSQPVALPNGEITDSSTHRWLNEYIDRLSQDYELSGAVLIAVGDRPIFERYFGFADAARSRPVSSDTLFNLASASKMFTALGIACLVSDGKLSYADTIDKFLPEYPDQKLAHRITISHLLSHSSGLAEYWTDQTAAAVRAAGSTAEMLPLVLNAGSAFEPGTKHAYSNSNFILAGIIVERITKKPFVNFVEERILTPLGMTDTGYFDTADRSRPIAEPLVRDDQTWKTPERGVRGTAAGGCYSNARDMLRFVRGVVGGKIVSPSMLQEMTTSKVRSGTQADSDYGLGFLLQQDGQVFSFGHGGIARGVNAEIRYFPKLDVSMILLNNQDHGAYDDLRKNITRLITGVR